MSRCVYCLNEKLLLFVCVECRTKLEISAQDKEWHKKSVKLQRDENFRLKKENERLRAEIDRLRNK